MNCLNRTAFLVLGLVTLATHQIQAAVIVPSGVQNNVNVSTVTGAWGWSVLYSGGYGTPFSPSVFAGAGDYLMLAAEQNGTGVLSVLAAANTADVLQGTAVNTTHAANGSLWYYNNLSMGFAPLGSTINQTSADTNDAPSFGGNAAIGAQKLSWHTSGGSVFAPANIDGGWRAGNVTFLNSEPSGWTRYVFTASRVNAVPEPASLTIMSSFAVAALFFARRRKPAKS